MADSTVSALSAASSPLAPGDILPVIQSSTSKRTTVDGLRDSSAWSMPRVNDYLLLGASATSELSVGGGTWRGGPMLLPFPCSWDRVRFDRSSAGTAACTSRVVLFNDNHSSGAGRPGTVLLDTANFASDTTGVHTITIAITPATRVIWAGIVTNGSPATAPKFRAALSAGQDAVWPSEDATGPANLFAAQAVTWGIATSTPGTDPTMVYVDVNGQPRFAFRRSA